MDQLSNLTTEKAAQILAIQLHLGREKKADPEGIDWSKISPEVWGALIGGGVGGVGGLLRSAMSKRKKKRYLQNMLLGGALGSVGGAGIGAGSRFLGDILNPSKEITEGENQIKKILKSEGEQGGWDQWYNPLAWGDYGLKQITGQQSTNPDIDSIAKEKGIDSVDKTLPGPGPLQYALDPTLSAVGTDGSAVPQVLTSVTGGVAGGTAANRLQNRAYNKKIDKGMADTIRTLGAQDINALEAPEQRNVRDVKDALRQADANKGKVTVTNQPAITQAQTDRAAWQERQKQYKRNLQTRPVQMGEVSAIPPGQRPKVPRPIKQPTHSVQPGKGNVKVVTPTGTHSLDEASRKWVRNQTAARNPRAKSRFKRWGGTGAGALGGFGLSNLIYNWATRDNRTQPGN